MSKEFEKLEALRNMSEPNDYEPQVDRGEAAKLAARWGWLIGALLEQGNPSLGTIDAARQPQERR
jgi:hypothetical protein